MSKKKKQNPILFKNDNYKFFKNKKLNMKNYKLKGNILKNVTSSGVSKNITNY